MNFFRDVVSHLLKNAFEGHTKFSVADNTAVGASPVRSISLDAVPVNDETIISLAWDGGEKLFEKTLSEQEAAHQFELISSDLAEVAALTKQGEYDSAKALMTKLGQKYAENTGDIVDTNLPALHNTQASTNDDKIWKEAKITMQNLWFSTPDELLEYQEKQKGAAKPGDQDHIPLWDKNKGAKPAGDSLAPASLSYEDKENQKAQEHEDMQKHIDEKIKTELESALQQKAASVFGPDQVELVQVLKKNGRNWDEIKKILTKDFNFDKDSVNIFVDEQRQGSDPAGVEVEPVKEDKKEDAPLTPPEELVSPETHDKLLQDHEDKKKGKPPVEEPLEQNFTPKDVMDIPEDEEIHDESALVNEIARADNDEIHKVAAEEFPTDPKWGQDHEVSPWKCSCGETLKTKNQGLAHYRKHHGKDASLKTAGPTDTNPLQEPIEQAPTTPQQDTIPMGKKPLDHDAPQKGDRVFVASDMADEKAGFEGTFVSTYKSEGRDHYVVETDEGDLLDVDAHRVTKISESDGAQTAEPSMEPQISGNQPEQAIPTTPKMSDFHTSAQDEALAIKAELDEMMKIVKEADSHVVMPMMYGIDDDSILQYANGSVYGDKIKSGQMQDKDWEALLKDTARWMTQVGRQKVSQTFSSDAEWLLDQEQINKLKSMFNVLPKSSSLKKEAGTTWHDLGMPEPPQAGWKVKHISGLTGTVVDGNDKFANVTLDKPIKNDEATCRELDLSWVQLERGDHQPGVYAIYAGDGFGSWNGSTPNWTMIDSGGQPIFPRGYTPAAAKPAAPAPAPKQPKVKKLKMEHDKNPNPEPAIDTESSVKTAADPVEPAKTQFKDYKITPKYAPKEEAVPATPEIDAVLTKMANLETNLATLETARKQIEAKMKEELAKVDQSGNRVEMEAQLQESIEKAAVLISAVNSKVVQWKDKLYTLQTEEVSYVPKLTPKEMLSKIYAKFDGAEKYVQDVLNGMLSQAKNVMENTLIRWPNKKSSLNKEATILDDMNHYNDELMAALKELSSPL